MASSPDASTALTPTAAADPWHLLRNSRSMAKAISNVTAQAPAEVRRRLWAEFLLRGSTVRRAARELGVRRYYFDAAMIRLYGASDAFLFELAIWNINWLKRSMRSWVTRWITNGVGTRRKVLCWGDGLGFDALALAQAGHEVTCFDLPGYTTTFAGHMLASGAPTVQQVRDPSELQEGAFDAVVCLDVLEHVPDAPAELHRIRKCLKPGGILAVHAPFYFLHRVSITHLRVNRPYSGSLAFFRKAGFRLIDAQPTWAPLVFQREGGTPMRRPLLAWPRLALALPFGLVLALGRFTALPFELINLVCRLAQPWYLDDMLGQGLRRANDTGPA